MTQPTLKAPFPAFGGKSQIVDVVWGRLGNPRNYIEPFAFSGAMLLRRPQVGAIETIKEIRIVLCGLEGEYPKLELAGWEVIPWKSRGGYGNRTEKGKENAARERLWINAACVKPIPDQGVMF